MPSTAGRLSRGAAIYGTSNLIQKGFILLLIPVYTRHLAPSEFGVVAIATAAGTVFAIVAGLGLRVAVTREFREFGKDSARLGEFVGTVLATIAISAATGLAILWAVASLADPSILPGITAWKILAPALLGSASGLVPEVALNLFRAREQAVRYAVFQIARTVLGAAFIVTSIIHFDGGAYGWLWAVALASTISAVGALIIMLCEDRLRIRFSLVRPALRYSLAIVPHLLLTFFLAQVDRLILGYTLDLAAVGIYAFAYQVAWVTGMAASSLTSAWSPIFFDLANQGPDGARRIDAGTTIIVACLAAIAVAASLFSQPTLPLLAGPDYQDASKLIPIIAFGGLCWGAYGVLVLPLFHARRTTLIPVMTLTSAIVHAATLVWLSTRIGLIGAALATPAGYAVLATLVLAATRRLTTIRIRLPKILFIVALACTGSVLGSLPLAPGHATTILRFGLGAVIGGILWLLARGEWSTLQAPIQSS